MSCFHFYVRTRKRFALYWHLVEFFPFSETPDQLCGLERVTRASIDTVLSSKVGDIMRDWFRVAGPHGIKVY